MCLSHGFIYCSCTNWCEVRWREAVCDYYHRQITCIIYVTCISIFFSFFQFIDLRRPPSFKDLLRLTPIEPV